MPQQHDLINTCERTMTADLSKASRYLSFRSRGSLPHSLVELHVLLPEVPEMIAALGDTPPALGIPTLIAEIWRLLRQRQELAGVISRVIQSSVGNAGKFMEEAPPAYQALAGYLDRGMNHGVVRRRNSLAAARCLIGTLWSFVLNDEVKVGEDLYPRSDERALAMVARMFLDGPVRSGKHALQRSAAGEDRHPGS